MGSGRDVCTQKQRPRLSRDGAVLFTGGLSGLTSFVDSLKQMGLRAQCEEEETTAETVRGLLSSLAKYKAVTPQEALSLAGRTEVHEPGTLWPE